MKATPTSSSSSPSHHSTTPTFIKIISFSLIYFTLFLLFRRFSLSATTQSSHLSFFNSTDTAATTTIFAPPQPPPEAAAVFERTGIINEMGIMTDDFIVGEFDEGLIQNVVVSGKNTSEKEEISDDDDNKFRKFEKFRVCDENMLQYVPCLDNMEADLMFNSSKYERHCPEIGKGLDCVVHWPKRYKLHIPWPKSRDEVWIDNIPNKRLVGDEGSQNYISKKHDKFVFAEVRTNQYLDQISKMVPEIAFGQRTRVALDIGSGVANFGAYLMERNVTTLSIGLKNVSENQIQLALERGVPAMLAAFGARRLPYPSQAFDLIHCSNCGVNWTLDDGLLLLEANRILRAGGYFIWAAPPVYKHELVQEWEEMVLLTDNFCWNLVNKENDIAIWQKPLNNSCYLSGERDIHPPLCDPNDNPDDIWYVNLKPCITRLPDNGYGANTTNWPARLHSPPDRLFTIQMDADKSRKELYKADSKYQNDIVRGYVSALHLNSSNIRNAMDMRAGYGGYAAALHDFNVDCWVMNVVPVSGANTLPVIYDRGLIGVMHDWCEPFDTYPRTYDVLNAASLFSVEQKRCNISNIMLEMDRILRPGGRVYIHDKSVVIDQVREIAKALGWVTFLFDSGEGPQSSWKLLTCEKRL